MPDSGHGLADKVVDNRLLLAVARVSMALAIPLFSFFWFITSQLLTEKAAANDLKLTNLERIMTMQVTSLNDKVETTADAISAMTDNVSKVSDRLTIIETRNIQENDSRTATRSGINSRLDNIDKNVLEVTKQVGVLTSELQTEREIRRRDDAMRQMRAQDRKSQ